jgi:para-nitrobenzyl esterase
MSVGVLLALPVAKGLFSQVILQSGAARNVLSSAKVTKVTNRLLTALGVGQGQDEHAKLKEVPIEKLVEA